jgi:AAA+ ATPase superfamily predicted ATPase
MSGGIKMIGQERLLTRIDKMIEAGFPRFTIICGETNSGKKTIAKSIAKKLNAHLIISEIKVDNIREIIELSYKQSEPTLYLIPDTDKMSNAAKNALLKVTEEPPRKAYFIMTLKDINNTLETLKSRGTIINLDPYTPSELLRYADEKGYDLNEEEEHIVTNICTVPGEIDLIVRYNIIEFYNFIKTVVNNIGVVNGANAFKIGTRLNYKDDDGGWDITLFMRAVMFVYRQLMIEKPLPQYRNSIRVTSKYLSQLNITGINKPSTIDMWILEMRAVNQEIEQGA